MQMAFDRKLPLQIPASQLNDRDLTTEMLQILKLKTPRCNSYTWLCATMGAHGNPPFLKNKWAKIEI